jgi:hypothetical protein
VEHGHLSTVFQMLKRGAQITAVTINRPDKCIGTMKYNGLRSCACKRQLRTYYLAAKHAAEKYPTIMNDKHNIQWLVWDVEDSVAWSAWAREALGRKAVSNCRAWRHLGSLWWMQDFD